MVRTLDKTHTLLSYVEGSLKNAIIGNGDGDLIMVLFSHS